MRALEARFSGLAAGAYQDDTNVSLCGRGGDGFEFAEEAELRSARTGEGARPHTSNLLQGGRLRRLFSGSYVVAF